MKSEIKIIEYLLNMNRKTLDDLSKDYNYKCDDNENYNRDMLVMEDRVAYLERVLNSLKEGKYPKC